MNDSHKAALAAGRARALAERMGREDEQARQMLDWIVDESAAYNAVKIAREREDFLAERVNYDRWLDVIKRRPPIPNDEAFRRVRGETR